MDLAAICKTQILPGKTQRRIAIRQVGHDAELVAVTTGLGKKETLLGILRDKAPHDQVQIAAMVAYALEHETGHMWAYDGCDTIEAVAREVVRK